MSEPSSPSSERKPMGIFKKVAGTFCHYCPVCGYGRRHPDSVIGKIVHHPLHANNCPFWNAEKELYQQT
jgi:hypothetical protein